MFNINEDKFVAKLTRNSDRTKVEKEVEADSHIEARELFKSMKSFWEKYFSLVRKVPKRSLSNTHYIRAQF